MVGGGFTGGAVVNTPPARNSRDTRDTGLIPVSGRSPGVGNGNSLQCSGLENSIDRGAWWATVHGVAESQTQLSTHTTTTALRAWCTPCFHLLPSKLSSFIMYFKKFLY